MDSAVRSNRRLKQGRGPPMFAMTLLRDVVTSAAFSAPFLIGSQKVSLISSITPRYFTAAFVLALTSPTCTDNKRGIPFFVGSTISVFVIVSFNPWSSIQRRTRYITWPTRSWAASTSLPVMRPPRRPRTRSGSSHTAFLCAGSRHRRHCKCRDHFPYHRQ